MKTRRKSVTIQDFSLTRDGNGILNASGELKESGVAVQDETEVNDLISTHNESSSAHPEIKAMADGASQKAELLTNPLGYQFVKTLDFFRTSGTTVTNLYFGGLFNDREWRAISRGEASMEIDLYLQDGGGCIVRAHGSLTPKELAVLGVTTNTNTPITTALSGNISGSMGYKGCAVNLRFNYNSSYRFYLSIDSIYYDLTNATLTAGNIQGTFTITVKPTSSLAGMTWAEVQTAVNDGLIPEGATKVGVINNVPYLFRLVDKTGTNIPLTAGGYAKSVWMADECLENHLAWNSSGSSADGYGASELYTALTTTIYNTVETDLKNVIKKVTLKSGKGGAGQTSTVVNVTNNTLFAPAQIELYGSNPYAVNGEGTQFNYFAEMGVTTSNYKSLMRSKKANADCLDDGNHNGTWYYWLRSPHYAYSDFACLVHDNGVYAYDSAGITYVAVAPCFCI